MQVQDGGGAPPFHQLLQLIQLQGKVRVSFIFHSVILGIVECLLTNIEDVNIGAVSLLQEDFAQDMEFSAQCCESAAGIGSFTQL